MGNGNERLPDLKVPREEAEEAIATRISEGRELLDRHPRSADAVRQLEADARKWSDYNKDLLSVLFTTDYFVNQYRPPAAMVYGGPTSLADRVRDTQSDVRRDIERLESIKERLGLLHEPDAAASSERHGPSESAQGRVFVVHGHDEATKQRVARFVETLGLEAVILHEQSNQGRTIIEKFEDHADVEFAVVLLTADDIGHPRGQPEEALPRPRQNVLLEMGYFIGALGRDRVVVLHEDGVEIPSDYDGVLYVALDTRGAWKLDLATEMQGADMQVDLNRVV